MVSLNVGDQHIDFTYKRDLLLPLLYPPEAHIQIMTHHETASDILTAFKRLIEEQEAPAIIIADLLGCLENKPSNDG